MATLVRNKTEGLLSLPAIYGGAEVGPGEAVIVNDTVNNVAAQFAHVPPGDIEFASVQDSQPGSITPAAGGGGANVTYTPGVGGNWAATAPVNVASALDKLAASGAGGNGANLAGDLSGNLPAPTIAALAVTTAKIAAAAVTNAKLANMNGTTLKGNATGGAAVPADLTSAQAAGLIGRILLNRQVISATGTYTPTAGTNRVWLRMIGGGGGGGGVANATAAQAAAGAGGASGAPVEAYIDPAAVVTGGAATIGAAGAAGANTGGAGGAGGDTTIVINGTTYTAKGGAGGGFVATGVLGLAQGGGFTAGSSAGDLSAGQEPGGDAFVLSGTIASAGDGGGASPFGSGGTGKAVQGAGLAGNGFGAGGAGGVSFNAGGAVIGGAGTAGVIVVWEFS